MSITMKNFPLSVFPFHSGMSSDSVCIVCKEPSSLKCGGCHKVVYCSKQHQKQHWKTHKHKCVPYKVVESPELGRCLVAIRNITPGEIVIQEAPLISGPLQTTPPICLGCYDLLTEFNSRDCERCGWPVCSLDCEKSKAHQPECDITSQYKNCKVKIHTFQEGLPHPSYQCLTVLRCLYQKKNNPKLWEKITKLQSHCKERKLTPKYESDRIAIAQFIIRFFQFPDFTEDEILWISGIVQVNAHEIPLAEPGYVSIYKTASFLEHSCHANCSKSFTVDGDLVIRAAVPIAANEHISICYTDPMWGTASRKVHLWETKFFECDCIRCKDPTELNTHYSSLKCTNSDCTGYIIPNSPPSIESVLETSKDEDVWSCSKCDTKMSSYDVMSLLGKIGDRLSKFDKKNEALCKKFIQDFENVLHPNHYYLTDVKLSLVQSFGQENGLTLLKDDDLQLKLKYCRELYNLTSVLVPAENRLRGVLLYELHAAIAENGRRKSNRGEMDPAELKSNLLECRKVLLQSYQFLCNEPDILPEGKIALQARKNIQDLDALLQNLYAPDGARTG